MTDYELYGNGQLDNTDADIRRDMHALLSKYPDQLASVETSHGATWTVKPAATKPQVGDVAEWGRDGLRFKVLVLAVDEQEGRMTYVVLEVLAQPSYMNLYVGCVCRDRYCTTEGLWTYTKLSTAHNSHLLEQE